jgi:hypothetical protein
MKIAVLVLAWVGLIVGGLYFGIGAPWLDSRLMLPGAILAAGGLVALATLTSRESD